MSLTVQRINTRFYKFSNWSYIIKAENSSSAVVVDPAWDFQVFEDMLQRDGIKAEAVFLTHSHFDHTNLTGKFIQKYNSKVYMSREEQEYYGFHCKNLFLLEDNQQLIVGGIPVSCFLTPGHTRGSMCFAMENNLFTGDTIFYEGCGLCDGKGGSAQGMYDSVQRIKDNFPLGTRIFPGHVYGKPVGQILEKVKMDNIYFNIEKEEDFIRFRMRKGQSNLFDFI